MKNEKSSAVTILKPKSKSRKKSKFDFNTKVIDLSPIRLILVWVVLLLGTLGLGWRLYYLQIIQGAELQKKAKQQQMVNLRPYIPRRSIIDAQSNVMATDRLVYTLYVHPKLFKIKKEEVAKKLADILPNKTSQKLLEQFKKQETGILLAKNLPETVSEKITELYLDGLEITQHYSRFYPQEEMAADIIGYVNQEHRPQAGIELSQQKLLERPLSTYRISRAGNGAIVPTNIPEGLFKVDDLKLQLTLNMRLQRAVRGALKEKIEEFNAKRGLAVVMDVRDGSLLALVCEPTFDPNQYYKYDLELFKNWGIADLYEPGSTFKPINIAIALDAGVIQPNDIINDSGKIKVDGWNISNHDYHSKGGRGNLSIAEVLQYSSNVAMIKIMQRLDKKYYYDALKKLELEKKLGIDLPGDTRGHLKSESVFTSRSIEPATAAFGQGLSLTPLKLIQLHAAIANGGNLVTPHVVRGLVDSQGQLHWQPSQDRRSIFSPQASRSVLEMMETVVAEGSGKTSEIPGYRIAGKTGTAQKASPNGGYQSNAKITSFVGILSVDTPRYVVLAVVDEPQGGNTFGSTVAAPIVKSIMEALISIEGIPPSKELPKQKPKS